MEQQLGPETKLLAEMVGGKIKLSVAYDGKQVDGGAYIMSDSDMLVDAIIGLFPQNAFVTSMGTVVKMALKSLTV